MELLVNTFFDRRERQLLGLSGVLEKVFASARMLYRVTGGLAAYLYVEEAEPDAGRLTKDIDVVVRQGDLPAIAETADPFGLHYVYADGQHMLRQTGAASNRRAVHLFPELSLGPGRTIRGIAVVLLEQLVRRKLATFRIKDQRHLKDLDEVRLIAAAIEQELPATLRERLARIRAAE